MPIDFEAKKQAKLVENEPMIKAIKDALGNERETTMRKLTDKLNLGEPKHHEMIRLSRCLTLMGWKKYAVRGGATRFIWRRDN